MGASPNRQPPMTKLLPLIALLAAAAPAFAQQPDAPRWTLGALAIDRDAPYRELDEGLLVVPLVRFEGERAYLRGLRGGIRLVESPGYELAVFAQARLDGYDAKDSPYLAGMDDRRASLDLGVGSTWTSQTLGALELSAAVDALDRSGGYELAASWTGRFTAGSWTLFPGASLRWQDAKMVDYYYGVRASEAVTGRAAYSADAALTPDVSLLATRPLGKRWNVFARASHARLPSQVTNSPLVDRNGSTTLFLGLGYSLD